MTMRSSAFAILVLSLDVAWAALKVKQMPATQPEEEWVPKDWYWPEANKSKEAPLKSSDEAPATTGHKRKTKMAPWTTKTTTPDPKDVDSPAPVFEMWPKLDTKYYEQWQLKKPKEDPRGKCKYTGLCEMRDSGAKGMAIGAGIGLLLEFIEGKFREKPKSINEKAIDQLLWMFSTGYLTSSILAKQGEKADEEKEGLPNVALFYDKYRPEDTAEPVVPAQTKTTEDYYRYKIPLESDVPLNPGNYKIINPHFYARNIRNKWLIRPEMEAINPDDSFVYGENPGWKIDNWRPFANDLQGYRDLPIPTPTP